jgi:hypothetical protein
LRARWPGGHASDGAGAVCPQPWLEPRTHVHATMLGLAWRGADRRGALGQVVRLVVAVLGSGTARYPSATLLLPVKGRALQRATAAGWRPRTCTAADYRVHQVPSGVVDIPAESYRSDDNGVRAPSCPGAPGRLVTGTVLLQPSEVMRSRQAASQRRHASAHTRQCSCIDVCCSHSSPHALHAAAHASSTDRVRLAS